MAQAQGNRTKTTFTSNIADMSLSHLLELMIALGSYREGLVLVGGWVPYLLLRQYQPTNVDFLGPEYGGTKKGKRHQRIQDDFLVHKARGTDVMFDHAIDITLEGKLPSGAEGKTNIKMANIVGIMTMKGIVVGARYKQKDAYDIHSLVLYYKTGPFSVAEELRPFIGHGLIKEAIESIHEKFRSREAEGPSWVAEFFEAAGEIAEQIKTQSYLQVQRFLTALYEPPQPPKKEKVVVPDETFRF